MQSFPRIYSDNDVAGLLYGPDDEPDRVLATFVRTILAEGWDVAGVLQRRTTSGNGRRPRTEFALVPEFEWVPNVPADTRSRAGAGLEMLTDRLTASLLRHPDLLVLNRFGSAELDGEGLTPAFDEAIQAEIPVVAAVPNALADAWLARTNGMSVSVDPDPGQLLDWWRSIGNGPSRANPHEKSCPHAS